MPASSRRRSTTARPINVRRNSRCFSTGTAARSYAAKCASRSWFANASATFSSKTSIPPRGTVLVSTPEATAVDLVGYQHQAGGLDLAATVLSELAEHIDAEKLSVAAATAPVAWAQRLGYLLEHVGAGEKAGDLKVYVRAHARQSTLLLPKAPRKESPAS